MLINTACIHNDPENMNRLYKNIIYYKMTRSVLLYTLHGLQLKFGTSTYVELQKLPLLYTI